METKTHPIRQGETHIAKPNAKHSYKVQVARDQEITIHADTRSQASKLAAKHGFAVWSVNMVG